MSESIQENVAGNTPSSSSVSPPMRIRFLLLLAFLLPTVACDQATKALAVEHLQGERPINVVRGFFKLTYAENPGAFLGLGRGLPHDVRIGAFVVIALLLLVFGVFAIVKARNMFSPTSIAVALIVAGGVGNLIDRVARPGSRVVDFMQMGTKALHTGVFNVADIYIMVGGALFVWATIRKKDHAVADHAPQSS